MVGIAVQPVPAQHLYRPAFHTQRKQPGLAALHHIAGTPDIKLLASHHLDRCNRCQRRHQHGRDQGRTTLATL